MSSSNDKKQECGPFIACGAAAVSLNHEPGEPTSIDNLISAVKRFLKRGKSLRDSQASGEGSTSEGDRAKGAPAGLCAPAA